MTEEQNTQANKVQTESIVKKVLTNEVKFFVWLVLFIFGIAAPYYTIKTDIALIKQNHLAHIEAMQRDILDLASEVKDMKKTEVQLMGEIASQNAQIMMLKDKIEK